MADQDWRKQVEGWFDWRNPGADPNWRVDATNDIKEMMGFVPPKPTMSAPNAGLIRSDNPRAGRDNWNQDPQFVQDLTDTANFLPGTPEYEMMLRRMGANLGKTQAPVAAVPAPPAAGAPAPSTAASRVPPAPVAPGAAPVAQQTGSDVAEQNRARAIGAQGRSPTPPPGVQAPAAAAAEKPASASDPNLPENKYPQSMIDQMEKDLTDLLTMRAPADPAALGQWRKLIETKRTELTRAKSAYVPQAGMGAGIPILQAREASVRADNILRAERQTAKDNEKAKDVLKQAQEHYKGDTNSPEFKIWLKDQGYTETGHKFKENMFDKAARQKAEDPKGQNPNHFTPAQIEAIKTQRAKELEPKPTTGMDTVKSQLKQMLDAGFIDEAAFRKGMNDPYSHGRTIEAVYDQYVKRFNPHPNSPFPENSA